MSAVGRVSVATLTEIVAAVVVHSSAAAYSHFGIALEPPQKAHPPVQRTVARSAAQRSETAADDCPEAQRAKALKV